jgi:cob(I)alamin adenosyltransferase
LSAAGAEALVRLNRIYTRTGDAGDTGLADSSRISKAHPRAQAIGDVDEANSALGIAALHLVDERQAAMVGAIQNELFDLGADLATPGEDFAPTEMALRIVQPQIDRLEREIDAMNEELEPLRSFILPGGSPAAAHLHLARAMVRRAERSAVAASAEMVLNPLALIYLNRLSDHLFVLARLAAKAGGGDVLWQPGATRG